MPKGTQRNPKVKNPLDDDVYDGNDEQIEDLKAEVYALQEALSRLAQNAEVILCRLAAEGNSTAKVGLAARKLAKELKRAEKAATKHPDPWLLPR